MDYSEIKSDLIACCKGLDGLLDDLTNDDILELNAVDCNWCENESDVSSALFAMYEQIMEEKIS